MKLRAEYTFYPSDLVRFTNAAGRGLRLLGLTVVLLLIFTVEAKASSHEMTIRVIENDDFSSVTELSLPPRVTEFKRGPHEHREKDAVDRFSDEDHESDNENIRQDGDIEHAPEPEPIEYEPPEPQEPPETLEPPEPLEPPESPEHHPVEPAEPIEPVEPIK